MNDKQSKKKVIMLEVRESLTISTELYDIVNDGYGYAYKKCRIIVRSALIGSNLYITKL